MSVLKLKEGGVWKDIPTIVGEAAGFGTVTATVDTNVGTPAVVVTSSGEDTAKNFAFQFKNLGYDDSDLQSDFSDLADDFDVLQGQFDTAVAAVTTDTEVTDIRVGADGVTDTTAGASVRRQFTDVKAEIKLIGDGLVFHEPVNWLDETKTSTWAYGDTYDMTDYISVNTGDVVSYYFGDNASSLGHSTPRMWVYYDGTKTELGVVNWTQDYTVASGVKYVKGVIAKSQAHRQVEINQSVTEYSAYFAPYYECVDNGARTDISEIRNYFHKGRRNIDGTYKKGTLSSVGTYLDTYKYRVAEVDLVSFPYTQMFYIADGFKVAFYLFKNGVFERETGWREKFYTIPPTYSFKMIIARSTENTSEDISDITEFIKAVYYIPYLQSDIVKPNACMLSIAHQGYSITDQQYGNSRLSSYLGAYQHGFECAETDIEWSSDGVPVCCHDPSFVDTNDGETVVVIAEHTAAELKTYGFCGETIATLDEVVGACKKYGLRLELDRVTSAWSTAQWNAVFGIVSKYNMQHHILWTCSEEYCAETILNYDKNAVLILNATASDIAGKITLAKQIVTDDCEVWIGCNYSGLTVADLIGYNAQIPEPNISIGLWTIDDLPTYLQFMPYASFITSNKLCAFDVISR